LEGSSSSSAMAMAKPPHFARGTTNTCRPNKGAELVRHRVEVNASFYISEALPHASSARQTHTAHQFRTCTTPWKLFPARPKHATAYPIGASFLGFSFGPPHSPFSCLIAAPTTSSSVPPLCDRAVPPE
ncbi:hypothetical protein E4U39_001070, partial [Claviceps sp. Clav50 group G5]